MSILKKKELSAIIYSHVHQTVAEPANKGA